MTAKQFFDQEQGESTHISIDKVVKLMDRYAKYYYATKASKPESVVLSVKSGSHISKKPKL